MIDALTGTEVESKFMGYCQMIKKPLRRIDIRFLPYKSFILHNYTLLVLLILIKDEGIALDLGYKLNEFGFI